MGTDLIALGNVLNCKVLNDLAWSDFKTVYIHTCCIPVVIGQFSCSVLTTSDAKGMLAIKSDRKNISMWYNFLNSGLNHTKLLNCDDYIAVT